ncbi:MAG: four helix bundle protein [Bacteroidota bacterium]
MEHKKLDVWNKSIQLVVEIYNLTNTFPKEEIYGLTSQIRRSAVSIPSNIAEGSARKGDVETIQFLHIALGSMAELETQLIISQKIGYIKNIEEVSNKLLEIKQMTLGLIKFLKSKK